MAKSKRKAVKTSQKESVLAPEIPTSVTSFRINLLALLIFLLGLYCLNAFLQGNFGLTYSTAMTIKMCILMLFWAVPVIVFELLYFKRLRNFDRSRLDIRRAIIKTFALYATLTLIGLIYWVTPEYHGTFYRPYWEMLKLIGPVVLIGSLPYFYLTDGFMENQDDSYSLLGLRLLGVKRDGQNAVIWQHCLGWLVKLFFLPLMTVYMYNSTRYFVGVNPAEVFNNFHLFYQFAWELIFGIDLVIVTIGYILTLKLLDSHIRSTEPTVGGWMSAIFCYEPFWSAISAAYLAYNKDNYSWGKWLSGNETGYFIWGIMILILITIYSLSSVAFGIRFSNLTHRGIITNGPYRYSKHPAYISKNLSWWLIAIPFIVVNDDYLASLQACVMLLGVNAIYYMRAKTEERHLGLDETYRQYQQAMEHHSLLGRLKRLILPESGKPLNR